ncbi:MAG TPA: RT0821/Lpp0805 family surface protein [Alphaproteobacteria bacterium]|nr:RT0821/Lpp0805 family surface protein [Alphaproteobacteria bacterium]
MKISNTVFAVSVAVALAACSDAGPKENIGTIVGGVGGAVIGSQIGSGSGQIVAAAAGTLIGAYLGREVGRSLDKADIAAAQQAQERAHTAPVGERIVWSNPETGHSGTVTPTRQGNDNSGHVCREYQTTVTVDGKTERAYGTACRQPDGSWKIVN